ncbi:MAG: hypothetical protein HOO67_01820 [Candidatus Peribacteraceae bacterium]|nr:hypothetical protein [Candidatus Peribacteraceae bacterium]
MDEPHEHVEPPKCLDGPPSQRSAPFRFIRNFVVVSAVGVLSLGTIFIGCRETDEQHMERIQDEESKKLLKMLNDLYDEIVSSKNLPEDIQAAELNEQVKAYAVAHAYEDVHSEPIDLRKYPILDVDPRITVKNYQNKQTLQSSFPELYTLKLEEGICMAVTMYTRKGKAVPRVVSNDKGVPEIVEDD